MAVALVVALLDCDSGCRSRSRSRSHSSMENHSLFYQHNLKQREQYSTMRMSCMHISIQFKCASSVGIAFCMANNVQMKWDNRPNSIHHS